MPRPSNPARGAERRLPARGAPSVNAVYNTMSVRVAPRAQLYAIMQRGKFRIARRFESVPRVWEILVSENRVLARKMSGVRDEKLPILVFLPLDRRRNTAYNRAD
jgi:hypothetical protein